MKKIGKFFVASAFMFVPVMVNAADVSDSTSLKDCLALESETCTVVTNIDVTDALTIRGNITLDLGANTVKVSSPIRLEEGAAFTINGTGKLTTTEDAKQVIRVGKSSTLTVNSGTIESGRGTGGAIGIEGSGDNDGSTTLVTIGENALLRGNYGIAIFGLKGSDNVHRANGVQLNVSGTIDAIADPVSGNGAIGITVNGNNKQMDGMPPQITINSTAKITAQRGSSSNANNADAPAIYAAGYANWNITGGEIEGDEVFSIKSGRFSVQDGKFTAKGEMSNPLLPYNNGSEATGAVVSITANDVYGKKVEIHLDGGTYISEKSNVVYEGQTNSSTTAVDWIYISNGTFEAKTAGMDIIKTSDEIGPFVSGGEFIGGDVSKYQYVDISKIMEILDKIEQDSDLDKVEINPDDYENELDYILAVLKTKYTEETATKFVDLLRELTTLENISRADQAKIDDLALRFEDAYSNLTLLNASTGTSPKTGDPIVTSVLIGVASLFGLGALLKFRKREL